jgi:hypothetical protein
MSTPVDETLSPAATQAVAAKVLTGAWSGRGLLKLLGELERWDVVIEAKKARMKKLWIGSMIGTFVGFVLMVFLFPYGIPLFLIPFVLIFVFKKKLNGFQAADIPDELRKSLRPVLKQLGQDLHPEEKIRGTIQLAGIDESRCKLKKDLPPGRNRSLKLSVFEEDLCDLRLPLADGSTAVLRLSNTFHKVERSYTSTRGKYKSKTKWKKLSTATAMLIPAVRWNWEPARMQKFVDTVNERLSFSEKDGVMAARLDRYYKFKAAGDAPTDIVPAADIMKLFVRLGGMRPAGGAR